MASDSDGGMPSAAFAARGSAGGSWCHQSPSSQAISLSKMDLVGCTGGGTELNRTLGVNNRADFSHALSDGVTLGNHNLAMLHVHHHLKWVSYTD